MYAVGWGGTARLDGVPTPYRTASRVALAGLLTVDICERAAAWPVGSSHHVPGRNRRWGDRSACLGIVGGYALSRRGPVWARILCGLLFASMISIWVLTVPGFGGPDLVFGMPRGTWVALYYWSPMVVSAMACAIPQGAVEQGERAPL